MTEEDYIPIDNAIRSFGMHLKSHPRTILSAGFGEGKTFFLHQCKKILSDCVFLTLYPVNYQVAANEDIFDLIKRDLLFQLFVNDILEPSYEMSQRMAISFFLSNPANYWEWVIDAVSSLDYPESIAMKAIGGTTKVLKNAYDCFKNFCKKNGIAEPNKKCLELWEKVEEKGIYENDVVTRVICDSIKSWKENNTGKRLVLLVEDLDRIDPAHLFRILNILSAHIDYSYKFSFSPSSETIVGNKFGVDNIVCVLDYNNLISIFRHFYGEYTSWEGYISKFSTKGYFEYSLSEEKCKYFYEKVANECDLDINHTKALLPEQVVKSTSMRQLNAAIEDIESQLTSIDNYNRNGIRKKYPDNLLKLFVIARRMGKIDQEILGWVKKAVNKNEELKDYILPYYFLKTNSELHTISLGDKDRNGYLIIYDFTQNNNEGIFQGKKSLLIGHNPNESFLSLSDLILFMLDIIGK